jgi:hypothetical protein
MTQAQGSTNGGFHHEDHDLPSPSLPTTIDDVAAAVGALAAEVRDQHLVVGERLQALHDRGGEHEKASIRRHDALLKVLQDHGSTLLAVSAELSALGRHVERLAPKADVTALGGQLARQALDSIAEGERQGAEIAATRADLAKTRAELTKTKALAVVRKGAFAVGVAAGTALALEWRAALKLIVSLFGGLHASSHLPTRPRRRHRNRAVDPRGRHLPRALTHRQAVR